MKIMDVVIPVERANREFRAKFPDDVMQDNLAGQLWFGAEVNMTSNSNLKVMKSHDFQFQNRRGLPVIAS